MTQIIPQPYPLYGFEYVGDPETRPNQPGALFLIVGWHHAGNDLDGNPMLSPMTLPVDGPTGSARERQGSFYVSTDLREAAQQRQEARRMDTYDEAGFDTDEDGGQREG